MTRRQSAQLVVLSAGMLLVSLDQYIVVVALPDMRRELGFSTQTIQAVITAYAVASAGLLLLAGRAADLVGARRVLVGGLAVYTAASVLGGLAWDPAVLLTARALQGLGGAMVFPTTLTLVSASFPPGAQRSQAIGIWGAAGAAGLVIGVIAGGVLTNSFGWEAVFLVNVVIATPVLFAVLLLFDRDPRRDQDRGFDLGGAATATCGISFLAYALVDGPRLGWSSPTVVALASGACVLLVAFVVIERRTRDPLVPKDLFPGRPLGWAVAIAFMFMATFGSVLFFFSLLLQAGLGMDALSAGAAFVPPTVAVLIGSAVGGRLANAYGLRTTVVVALALGAAGAAALAWVITPGVSYAELLPGFLVVSLADGVIFTSMFLAATVRIPEDQQGVASGMASVGAGFGAIVGLAVLVLIANGTGDHERLASSVESGVSDVLVAVAVGILLTVPLALRLPNERTPRPADHACHSCAPAATSREESGATGPG